MNKYLIPLAALVLGTTSPAAPVTVGKSVTLTVTADGSQPFNYQWFKDNVPVPGATTDTLVIPNFTTANAGVYYASVTNVTGSTNSNKVQLEPVKVPSNATIKVTIAVGTVNP